jgi:hypothetical protein
MADFEEMRNAVQRATQDDIRTPLQVWDVYNDAVHLFGLNKAVADECDEIVIRLSVGDVVRVEYKTHGTKAKCDVD